VESTGRQVQLFQIETSGWLLWTSDVRPGREHDTTAARVHPDLLTDLATWVDDDQLGLADLGYEAEASILRIPIKKPADGELTVDQQAYNTVHGALRYLGERAIPAQVHFQSATPLARLPLAHRPRSSPPRWSACTSSTGAQPDSVDHET
jgi:hypothetical protein